MRLIHFISTDIPLGQCHGIVRFFPWSYAECFNSLAEKTSICVQSSSTEDEWVDGAPCLTRIHSGRKVPGGEAGSGRHFAIRKPSGGPSSHTSSTNLGFTTVCVGAASEPPFFWCRDGRWGR